jgi:hypothetical protein
MQASTVLTLTPILAAFNPGLLIPIIAIVMGCSIAIVGIIVDYRRRRATLEFQHKERLAAIEKGIELPPALGVEAEGSAASARRPSYLLRGLVWLFLGIGVALALNRIEGRDEAMLGAIPIGIGLAYLIYYFAEGRKLEAAAATADVPAPSPSNRV